jgi:hypothetical protein
LNEVTYVEAARKLAERMILEGGPNPEDRIKRGFRLATGREITPDERKVLLEGLTADLDRYRRDPEAAGKLVAAGQSKADATIPPADLAAYTLTANILLNLDEVVTRE